MATYKVNVNKLNLRRSPVKNFADKRNVVGVLHQDALFESKQIIENELGKWHVGEDGFCVSEKWLGEMETASLISGKRSFEWFDNLKVANIWSKYSEKGGLATIAVLDTGYNINNSDIETAISKKTVLIDKSKYKEDQLVIEDRSTEGHGSRCSSLIGCRNELQFLVGIAPECKMIVGKISIDREIRNFDYILNGIDWAIKEGADIISISYACQFSQEEADLNSKKFEEIIKDKDVLIFASSGNTVEQKKEERYPASFTNCISTGSVDENRNISTFTILSDKTILHTIGSEIESYGKNFLPDPQSGTSYSTPIIAAVAGLAISYLRRKGKETDTKLLLEKLINTGDGINNFPKKKAINIERFFETL